MPQLDEGAFLLQTVLPAEAALDEVDRLNHRVEDILREVPEVEDVVRRTGRAERTEDPMPHTVSDVLVVLKTERTRDLPAIEEEMRERLEHLPGVSVLFTTPLGMRIDEGLGGTPADLSVRIFGPDLDELARLAERAEEIIKSVDGIADLRAEQLTGLPQLQIAVNRDATARVGLAPGDVIRAVRIGLVGEEAAQMWIGQRRFDLIVRLRDDSRSFGGDPDDDEKGPKQCAASAPLAIPRISQTCAIACGSVRCPPNCLPPARLRPWRFRRTSLPPCSASSTARLSASRPGRYP